jgi:integrase
MIPIIGELKLSELRASHIQSMYHALAEQLSDYSMRQVNAVLGKALKDAVKEGVLLFNPLDRLVSVPTARPKEMNSLTAEEAAKLLAVDNEWAPLFTVLVGTGLRIGEALGLTWTSIYCACGKPVNDEAHRGSEPECLLKMARLVVRRTLQRVPGQGLLFSEPKTEKSRRAIPLSAPVITALKKHLSRQAEQRLMIGADWSNQDLVFSNEWGNLMEPTRVNRALKRSLKLARITKHVRVHDLRHTAASLMVRHGVAPKAVQETLGHSTYATTMDVYVHADEEMLENAVNILGEAISGVA